RPSRAHHEPWERIVRQTRSHHSRPLKRMTSSCCRTGCMTPRARRYPPGPDHTPYHRSRDR
ncbi:unnamed protein product, partial [Mycena citricolor]